MCRRAGFTMIEMLMVLLVLGLLTGIGLLKYMDLRNTARTSALAGDIRSVTLAVVNYYADYESWPPESGPTQVPNGLAPYLPGALYGTLDRIAYQLDYENINVAGSPLIGISVDASDPRILAKFIQTFSRHPFFMNGGRLTYLIAGPGGMF